MRAPSILSVLLVVAMGAAASNTAATAAPLPSGVVFPPGADKLGAGLLLVSADSSGKGGGDLSILLLKRTSKHHGGAWGLPGGNVEPGDANLLATAAREAGEELGLAAGGGAPPYAVRAQLTARRGKKGQKVYAVFVAQVAAEDARVYAPRLNEEHSDFRWWVAKDVERLAAAAEERGAEETLHPVVALAMREAGGVAGLQKLLEADGAM